MQYHTCSFITKVYFSVQSFEFTSESGIFDLFQVPLYHGWLVDPQDRHTYDVVCTLSYNQLVEMIINNQNSADPINIQNGAWVAHLLHCYFMSVSCINSFDL